jgi:hypothetical protein
MGLVTAHDYCTVYDGTVKYNGRTLRNPGLRGATMPLMDHFHPPLSQRRQWHAFHHAWATFLAAELNRQLPKGYIRRAEHSVWR